MYLDFKSENHLAVACPEKKSEFRWLIVKISEIKRLNFQIQLISKRQGVVQIQPKIARDPHYVHRI